MTNSKWKRFKMHDSITWIPIHLVITDEVFLSSSAHCAVRAGETLYGSFYFSLSLWPPLIPGELEIGNGRIQGQLRQVILPLIAWTSLECCCLSTPKTVVVLLPPNLWLYEGQHFFLSKLLMKEYGACGFPEMRQRYLTQARSKHYLTFQALSWPHLQAVSKTTYFFHCLSFSTVASMASLWRVYLVN